MNAKDFLRFTLLASIVVARLHANETAMTINSNVADYNGKMITLSGQVIVEHELGKISAESMEISADTEDSTISTQFLRMRDGVNIALADGGNLSCAASDIDYGNLSGEFHSNARQEYVVYTEEVSGKSNAPLILKSRHMTIELAKEGIKSDTPSRRCINSITADDHVTVNYQNDFNVAADFASYQRLEPQQDEGVSKKMTGLIALYAANEESQCQVITKRGDLVKAARICIDTIKRQLLFAYPKGALESNSAQEQRIDFSSDTMTWDANSNVLTLYDHIVVNQQGLGVLNNDKEIRLIQQTTPNGKQLTTIEGTGTSILTFLDDERELSHVLTCYGKALVDNIAGKTIFDSPRTMNGKVLEGKQVSFKDNMGEIFADKLIVEYTLIDSSPIPTKILLEGNVHIFGRNKASKDDVGAFLQYAIADRAEYSPQAKELLLKSDGKNRVLFYDRMNSLQISANQLKVRRDQATSKESVQGVGEVRFSFVQDELDQMKKHFQLD